MKFQLFLWVIVALAFSCKKQTITNAPNKFSDSVLVSIHEYKDQRATDQLLNFLNSENTTYQSEAALALASVGSNIATPKLIDAFVAINSLTPENVLTQKNLGYAIYQSAEQLNKSDFLKLYQASVNSQVLQYVLWTLGKSSDFKNDSLLWFGFDKNQNEAHYKKGMIKGF
ncbi:MAG: HEAT repeat domain-containing protein, partial [Bacteroidia bacterium]